MTSCKPFLMSAAILSWAGVLGAADDSTAGPFAPLAFLLGEWSGVETGAAGNGTGGRTYEYIMDGRYLVARNTSTFPPQEKNPAGEVHQDWSIFSHDEARQVIVLREFHSEGFVIRYVMRTDAAEGTLVFESESVENAPPGTRARLTLQRKGDGFDEVFEVGFGGEEPKPLLRNSWHRNR